VIKNLEKSLEEESINVKRLQSQVSYYREQLMKELNKHSLSNCSDMDAVNALCERIEQAFGILKGARGETKAMRLLELISSGLQFKGAGVSVLQSLYRDYIRKVFRPWKLVFSSDMAPAGAFRTATVSGLSEFFDSPGSDEEDEKQKQLFPSASTVARERQALNKYALQEIGFRRRESPYGEMYYVNPEKVQFTSLLHPMVPIASKIEHRLVLE
jgi:hypothetical protein